MYSMIDYCKLELQKKCKIRMIHFFFLFSLDLFQRAILMSGSALSDWALVKNPILNTIQVGQSLNCGPGGNEKFFDCLRRKRFTDLVSTKMYLPPFVTVFGPMVDGVMITNEPLPLLKEHKNLMNKYVYTTTE